MGLFRKRKQTPEREVISGYDYTTPEKRVETASALFNISKDWRSVFEAEWRECDAYYNFRHTVSEEYREYCKERDLPWVPATVPDPYIQVESQIIPNVPEPEFRGRDDDQDSKKAKIRELAVRFVCENNRITDMNTSNERRLVKLGDAWWKAYWDKSMRSGVNEGDIRLLDVALEDIYPDPSVGAGDFQEGQYLIHVYRMHKVRVGWEYGRQLEKLGLTVDELVNSEYSRHGEVFEENTSTSADDDMVQIMEHWYKNPIEYFDEDIGKTVPAGAVCCSIQAGSCELKHVPLYWRSTWRQCSLFPFVHYWRIRDDVNFYNKSELFAIKDLVDAADRKLGNMLLNDAMMSNDIILAEEGAFADGCEPVNEPGAIWLMKQNRMGGAARLGGLHSGADNTLVNFLSEQIQRASRNYDSNMGRETSRATTATGLAMLRDDANSQADIKKNDRLMGFERLFELIDWLCLEFYDDDRLLYIGAKDANSDPEKAAWKRELLAHPVPEIVDIVSGDVVKEAWEYYPRVDVTLNAGDGIIRGPQATINALERLLTANINESNYKLFIAELEVLDIPQKKAIKETWEQMFAPAVPKELTDQLAKDPQLLQLVQTLAAGAAQPQMMGGAMNAMPGM